MIINPIKDLDRLKQRLIDKGLVSVSVDAYLRPTGEYGSPWWIEVAYKFKEAGERQSFSAKEKQVGTNEGWLIALAEANKHIDGLPTPEEAEHQEFLKLLARVVEKGRDVGVDDLVLNPLIESMKRLSENALEHHRHMSL